MTRFAELLRRFRRDERGVFAVLFGILAIVLIATSGAVVDFTKTEQARTRAQTALDSAALALQGQINTLDEATLKSRAQTIVTERLNDATITAVVDTATKNVNAGTLNLQAHIQVSTAFVQFVGITSIRSNLQSEVTRASSDLEVSVSLDVTGSMAPPIYDRRGNITGYDTTKIDALIDATNDLIDLLVKDTQTPTYSKMAIIPWSAAVNVGSYATSVRGAVRGPWSISNVSWASGTQKTITCITKANPGVVTSNGHGFANGNRVYFSGVTGMTQLNGNSYVIANVTTNTFSIVNTSSGFSTFTCTGGSKNTGKVQKCQVANGCELVATTSTSHTLTAGESAYFTDVGGMTALNGNLYTVLSPTSTTFALTGTFGPSSTYAAYTSGGSSACVLYGCSYYRFDDANSGTNYQIFPVTTCATDRTTNAYTDAAPSTTLLSYHYTNSNPCLAQAIQPLTTDKTVLHALANSLVGEGSTAGHLGLAWGWYMIAPNFSYLWPTASQPAAYNKANLIKAVVFMTDGVFNTPYCNGVIASDALSGSGSVSDHINCASPNGASKAQATALCNAIKAPANNTLLYVVGFDLAGDEDTLEFLEDCATSSEEFFQADDGTDLSVAFQSIYESLSDLRLSK